MSIASMPSEPIVYEKPEEVTVEKPTIEEYIKSKSWDGDVALAVMQAESNGNPHDINRTPPDYSVGLFQINLYGSLAEHRPSEEWLLNEYNNIDYAHQLWKENGWQPWSVCQKSVDCYPQDSLAQGK